VSRALRAILPLFFLSGAVALGCETVYFRWLGLLFGAAHEVTGALLASFMAGLALGSELGARVADRSRSALRLYAAAEAVVGAYALASVLLFPRAYELAATTSTPVRLILAFALLALPTMAMGATLPLLAAAVVPSRAALRGGVAALYATNLAGGVVGALVAGFILLPRAGLHASTQALGAAALLVAACAFALGSRLSPPTPARAPARAPAPASALAPWLAAGIGVLSFGLQVAWNRVFSILLGSSAYTFALVVAVILGATALGGAASARNEEEDGASARARGDTAFWKKVARRSLALALTIYLGTLVVYVAPFHLAWAAAHVTSMTWIRAALVAFVVGVPSYQVGALFPALASRFPSRGVGRAAGRAVLVSTLGNVTGALGAAFVVIPALGVQRTLALASGLALVPALLAARRAGAAPFRGMSIASVMALALATLLSPGWDAVGLSAGSYRVGLYRERQRHLADANECGPHRHFKVNKVLFHRDGPVGTVVVLGHDGGPDCALYSLRVNGKAEGSVFAKERLAARVAPSAELLPIGDLPSEVLAGLLPAIAGPPSARAFLVGWGTGISTRALLDGGARNVESVELEPAVIEAGRLFDAEVQTDPRVHITIDDARMALRRAGSSSFDVIVSHPSNPWVVGASALFSREYFELLRDRMTDGGRALAWIQLYEIDRDSVRALVATFVSVFPDAHAFRASPTSRDVFLLGLKTRVPTSRAALAATLAARRNDDGVRRALARAGFTGEDPGGRDLGATYIGDGETLRRFSAGAPVETDERGALEFRVADHVLRGTGDLPTEILRGIE
jgi:hypothetical protein